MKYSAKIDLTNRNNSHTLAYELVEFVAQKRTLSVLEVGCSAGYLGSALKEIGHSVFGVEPSSDSASEAKKVLDDVFEGFIQDFFLEHPESKFDVIIFGDVLEHLPDPHAVLLLCKDHLTAHGAIVASVPNIAHVAIRAMLLEGRWEYADLGILDRTHMRFFTRSSLIQLFTGAAYSVLRLTPVQLSAEQVDEMCGLRLNARFLEIAKDSAKDNQAYDFQYVLLARPSDSPDDATKLNASIANDDGTRILCITDDVTSHLVDLRLRLPLEQWVASTSGRLKFVCIGSQSSADIDWCDVAVFQRHADRYALQLIKHFKAIGKKVVFEIDDLLTNIPAFLAHHVEYYATNGEYLRESLRIADAVTVTTPRLANELSVINKNVSCVPNCSKRLGILSAEHFDVSSDAVTLFIASSDKVLVDFLIPALKLVQEKFAVKILAIGPPGESLSKAGLRVTRAQTMDYNSFKKYISSENNSIGVIPLDSSNFSSCKSPIKFFDYAMAGVPSICSNVPPYSDHVLNGETGFLADNTTVALYQAMEKLILDHALRRRIAQQAMTYVEEKYSPEVASVAWAQLIEKLIPSGMPLVRTPSQVSFIGLPRRRSVASLLGKLASPSAYAKLLHTLRTRGLKEVLRMIYRR